MMRPFKAALSFSSYRQGRWYDLDPDDAQVKSLVGAGYFIPTVDVPTSGAEFFNGGDDNDPDVSVPDADVVAAKPKRKRKVADGQGEVEPGTGQDDGAGADDTSGGQDDEPDQ